MQLEGCLSRFALRELLELCSNSLVTGAIEIQAPSGTHLIFFVEGRCVHASSPAAQGFDALWPLFELGDAPFRFVAGQTTPERTVVEPTPNVIDQAVALARQWSRIRPHIPDLDIVPEFVTPANGEQVRIYEEDWPILSGVDGSRTIAEVAHYAVLDPIEVCTGLLRLKERGLLRLSRGRAAVEQVKATKMLPPAPRPKPRLKAKAASQPAEQTSFFAKLLVAVPEDVLRPVEPLPDASTPEPAERTIEEVPAAAASAEAAAATEYDDILRLLRA
ncbi:MAG TPA: DUF4388 domain-containing protein [Herpetosiphonaceae bacterium]